MDVRIWAHSLARLPALSLLPQMKQPLLTSSSPWFPNPLVIVLMRDPACVVSRLETRAVHQRARCGLQTCLIPPACMVFIHF